MTYKRLQYAIVISGVIFLIFMASRLYLLVEDRIKAENAIIEIRNQNDGAVPDIELLGSDGFLYNVITFDKEPDIICIGRKNSKQMGCFNKGDL